MGGPADPWAVVDAVGAVKGLGGLRVVDASIIPEIPSDGHQPHHDHDRRAHRRARLRRADPRPAVRACHEPGAPHDRHVTDLRARSTTDSAPAPTSGTPTGDGATPRRLRRLRALHRRRVRPGPQLRSRRKRSSRSPRPTRRSPRGPKPRLPRRRACSSRPPRSFAAAARRSRRSSPARPAARSRSRRSSRTWSPPPWSRPPTGCSCPRARCCRRTCPTPTRSGSAARSASSPASPRGTARTSCPGVPCSTRSPPAAPSWSSRRSTRPISAGLMVAEIAEEAGFPPGVDQRRPARSGRGRRRSPTSSSPATRSGSSTSSAGSTPPACSPNGPAGPSSARCSSSAATTR